MNTQENSVIGPIGPVTWNTMRRLNGSLKHYRANYRPIYDKAIEKEKALLHEYMDTVLKRTG